MEHMKADRRIASLKRFAEKNDVTERQVRHWIDLGAPHIRIGKSIYVDEAALWGWLDQQATGEVA